ncbi:hypothetical protein TNCV_4544621 [Trichonephila clavipes]|nr:hypothetical protein TNCV_4544621 [Trichonephila clavipes]
MVTNSWPALWNRTQALVLMPLKTHRVEKMELVKPIVTLSPHTDKKERIFMSGGQLDGWKWDCRRHAARRLNVSRSVVQRLWDQYQSEDSVSKDLFQADHELQHLQKTVF